ITKGISCTMVSPMPLHSYMVIITYIFGSVSSIYQLITREADGNSNFMCIAFPKSINLGINFLASRYFLLLVGRRSFSLKYCKRVQIRFIHSVGVSFDETIPIEQNSSHSASVQLVPRLSLKLAIVYDLFIVFIGVICYLYCV